MFETELAMLKSRGHQVIPYTRHSDDIRKQGMIGMVKGAFSTPWNYFAVKKLRLFLHEIKPDVMHVHNSFPLFSPGIFYAAKDNQVATVLTLHNYRNFCAVGIPLRDDKPCTLCIDRKSIWPAMRYGCYRNSRLATLPMALMIALHRYLNTWGKKVDVFIALTKFQRKLLVNAGLPENKIHIKPQFYPNPPRPLSWTERENKIVFVGRLGNEKGVRFLLEAWKIWPEAPLLEIIGEGVEGHFLREESKRCGLINKISFLGQLSHKRVQHQLSSARLMILPSINFEGFPMTISEAFALGVPVAASNLGSMASLIEDGRTGGLFEPANADSLASVVQKLWGDQIKLAEMAVAARDEFELHYTEEVNYQQLIELYSIAIDYSKRDVEVDCDIQ